ncbi:MAG: hypothetical protein SWK76_14120 [Actinomycetota bacterium]|nr:hypothetical protein [Actinomycetota bacterium]
MRKTVSLYTIFVLVSLSWFILAVNPCVADPDLPTTWYFAEGTTREGFFEYISMQNPGSEETEVNITYMTNLGEMGPYTHIIPPVSRGTVLVNVYMDEGLDVSVRVESERGIVAERPIYFTYKDKWKGGHVVLGVNSTNEEWYFAEGTTRPGFEEWLCIQNPQDDSQRVTVTYYTTSAVEVKSYDIAPRHRFTIDVNTEVAELWLDEPYQDVSLKVEGAEGIIAERPMYFQYEDDWEGGHIVLGETDPGRNWYLAEGYCQWNFDTWLCFLNPGLETAQVIIEYRRSDGYTNSQTLNVPGYSRQTVDVNAVMGQGEFSFQVTSDQDIVVERPIYFDYNYVWEGGHDNMAVAQATDEWYLAEGATWHGIETYLCILNPLDVSQNVVVEYLMENGGYEQVEFTIPPESRYTRDVNADVGADHNVSFRIKAFKNTSPIEPGEIVVERPMYFLYGGSLPGGHVASGYGE